MTIAELSISPKPSVVDVIIDHQIPIEWINETFCWNAHNHRPSSKNITMGKIRLYTFPEMLRKLTFDVSKIKFDGAKTIVTDFLEYYSNIKHGTKQYKRTLDTELIDQISTYISVSCSEESQKAYEITKQYATIAPSNNLSSNHTCHMLLDRLFKEQSYRFAMNNKIEPLTFKKNDKISYYYTLIAKPNIKRVYEIRVKLIDKKC